MKGPCISTVPSYQEVFEQLLARYGPQHWWPAETPFEVMLGAVLTQNTAWTNVEQALAGLASVVPFTPEGLLDLPVERLAESIRPSGYYNLKARRLRALCEAIVEAGGEAALAEWPTEPLREFLLSIHGVGPETADDILLYAFDRPVFVVDAYTRRLFERLGLLAGGEPYEDIRAGVEASFGPNARVFNEFHALILAHAKDTCRARSPLCDACLFNAASASVANPLSES